MTIAVNIVYLHGLNSSPQSVKARALGDAIGAFPDLKRPRYFVPQLAHRPEAAMREVRAWIEAHDPTSIALVGSSLGGFYATHLAERYRVRAVLINPAVRPYENLVTYLGRQRNLYTGEKYELTPEHFAELQAQRSTRSCGPIAIFFLSKQATRSSTGAKRWRFTEARGSPCMVAAITRSAISGNRFRRYCSLRCAAFELFSLITKRVCARVERGFDGLY